MLVIINSDKSCLIFLEAQLKPVWSGSQRPSWRRRISPPFLQVIALFLMLGNGSTSHSDITLRSPRQFPPSGPAWTFITSAGWSLDTLSAEAQPHVVERLGAAQVWGVPYMPLGETVHPRPHSSCSATGDSRAHSGCYWCPVQPGSCELCLSMALVLPWLCPASWILRLGHRVHPVQPPHFMEEHTGARKGSALVRLHTDAAGAF